MTLTTFIITDFLLNGLIDGVAHVEWNVTGRTRRFFLWERYPN